MRPPVPQSKRNPEMNDDGDFEDFEPIAPAVFDPIPPTKSESGFGNSERSVFSNGRLDLVPLARQPETRFQHGLRAIAWALSTGCRDGIPDALRRASYADPAEFWQDFLSQRMTAGDFIHRMASFHFSPAMNGIDLIEMGLSSLLKEAARDEEPFILKNGKIEPGGAVRWLLSMPRQRSHVPPELALHIEGANLPPEKHPGGRPEAYDWTSAEAALAQECKLCGGIPRRDHTVTDWRTKADAQGFVRDYLEKLHGKGPEPTALKEKVGPMLNRIDEQMKKVGN